MRLLILLILLSSCSYNAWQRRGFKKGWLDTTSVTSAFEIKKDTVYRDSLIEVFIQKVDSIYKIDTITKHEVKEKVRYIIKTELLPATSIFKDTTIVVDDNISVKLKFSDTGITGEVIYNKTQVIEDKRKWYQKPLQISFQGFIIVILLLLLLVYIVFKK